MAKNFPLVLVEWVDPWSKSGWNSQHEVEEAFNHTNTCHSVGWIIKQDKEKILLATARSHEEEETGDLFLIPRRCIDLITPLEPCPSVTSSTTAKKR